MSNKVVYNGCYGGFSLSREAILLARKISGNSKWGGPSIKGDLCENGRTVENDYGYIDDMDRHDPVLVEVVERLGEKASGRMANLLIAHVGSMYRIDEYDGNESVEQPNSIDWVVIK